MSVDEFPDDESEYVPPSPAISYASTVPTLALDDGPPPSPVIPVLDHYEVCYVPDADNEQGVFATEDIEEGTRVICERPLFTLPHPGDQLPELMFAYENLNAGDKYVFDGLRAANVSNTTELLHNIDELTMRLFAELSPIAIKPPAERTDSERETFDFLMPKFTHATRCLRTAARWHANRCSMINTPHDQRSHLPRGTPVSGLFIQRSQMRHSCIPNCFASYNASNDHLTVHATRFISAGEELTVSAFADETYYLDASSRHDRFATWGLTCTCEACDTTHPCYTSHENARLRARTRAILVNDALTRLDIWDSDRAAASLYLPSAVRAEHEPAFDDLQDLRAAILGICNDLTLTGCSSVEVARWRVALVERVLPRIAFVLPAAQQVELWRGVLAQARLCEVAGAVCYGVDREEFELLRGVRERVEVVLDQHLWAKVERESERGREGVVKGKGKGGRRMRKARGRKR